MPTTRRKHAPVKVLLVDDHPAVREGLAVGVSGQPDLEVCGEAADAREAMRLAGSTAPDVAVVDISLGSGNGLELIKRLKSRHKSLSILVLSMHDEALYAERALRAGALGYVSKSESTKKVIAAIRQVRKGKVHVSRKVADRLLHLAAAGRSGLRRPAVEALSDRELEVFELIGNGASTGEIARRLHLSVHTVETHRQRIKAKLNLKRSAELARHAASWVLQGH